MANAGQMAEGERRELKVNFRGIEAPLPWQAVVLPVSEYPLKAPEYGLVRRFLGLLTMVLEKEHRLRQEVLLQMWKIAPESGAGLVSSNGKLWKPQIGLGIWPDREPPTSWSQATMQNAVAAAFRGDEPTKPYYNLLRLTCDAAVRSKAAETMCGYGTQIQTFSKLESDALLERSKKTFLPMIRDNRFKNERFYLPLLDSNTVTSAGYAERLDACLCGIDFYLRESPEDKGILIVTKIPLDPLLKSVKELSSAPA